MPDKSAGYKDDASPPGSVPEVSGPYLRVT